MQLERVIFNNLLYNEEYCRKVIPFLLGDYFHDRNDRLVYELIDEYITKYNRRPTKEALQVNLTSRDDVLEDQYETCSTIITDLNDETKNDIEWLLDSTEKFCQDKAIYNAIMESIKIMDDKTGKKSKGQIPELLTDALSITFDSSIGHDYFEDAEKRWEFYTNVGEKLVFSLEFLNKITKGGVNRKTLNLLMAPTGVGKSLIMCDLAASFLEQGRNVLYITLEMSEERISERIDANLINVDIDDIPNMAKDVFLKKVNAVKEKTVGKLIIKEYPTSGAGSANFRHLLQELKSKKGFVPDVIFIDYINICNSSRLKGSVSANTNTYIKAIAEELRGLAVEFDVAMFTATQVTRDGMDTSDINITQTSESIGLTHTVDIMLAVMQTEELVRLNQFLFKQLKNRYADANKWNKFTIGVDKNRMRLYDVEGSAQHDLVSTTPAANNMKSKEKFKKKFQEFK
jgi:replicative DNA helicase